MKGTLPKAKDRAEQAGAEGDVYRPVPQSKHTGDGTGEAKVQMHVRWFRRDCFRKVDGKLTDTRIDTFWVEATQEEAESSVFPFLQPQAISGSRQLADMFKRVAAEIGNPPRPFGFQVARDLSVIEPHPPHHPFHQFWGAYSPFEQMPEVVISSLDALRQLDVPTREQVCPDEGTKTTGVQGRNICVCGT